MKIYYFPTKNGHELEPIEVALDENGTANLSKLPDDLQDHLSSFGIINAIHTGQVMPNEGKIFLECLLLASNPKMIFREYPRKSNL